MASNKTTKRLKKSKKIQATKPLTVRAFGASNPAN